MSDTIGTCQTNPNLSIGALFFDENPGIDGTKYINCSQLVVSNILTIYITTIKNINDKTFSSIINIGPYSFGVNGVIDYQEQPIYSIPSITGATNNSVDLAIDITNTTIIATLSGGDTYIFTFPFTGNSHIAWFFTVKAIIKVDKTNYSSNGVQAMLVVQDNPEIFISSQLLIDASDIGNSIFEVRDIIGVEKKFEKVCIKIVSVLRGIGATAYDKISYLYKTEMISIRGAIFINNLHEYALVRYFLSKLLYGKWNINYLLGKYYSKFIRDLEKSKFYNFVDYFISPQSKVYKYDKYFLRD